jgi:hypothetical protein
MAKRKQKMRYGDPPAKHRLYAQSAVKILRRELTLLRKALDAGDCHRAFDKVAAANGEHRALIEHRAGALSYKPTYTKTGKVTKASYAAAGRALSKLERKFVKACVKQRPGPGTTGY